MKPIILIAISAPLFLGGCFDTGFFQSAADHPVGAKDGIPKVAQNVAFPKVSEIVDLNSVMGGQGEGGADAAIPGFPTDLADGSFAHLRGIFSMTGECRRDLALPLGGAPERDTCLGADDELDPSGTPQYACLEIVNCSDDPRCADTCGDFRGLMLDLSIDASFLTTEQALQVQQEADINFDVGTDAVTQIRLQFFELELYQMDGDEQISNNNRYFDFRFGARRTTRQMHELCALDPECEAPEPPSCPGDDLMADEDEVISPDCIVVVNQKYLDRITPESPERFDLGSSSQFTTDLKRAVLDKFKDPENNESPSAALWLKFAVSEEQLYELNLEGAGVELDVQPEFVINVLEVAKGQL